LATCGRFGRLGIRTQNLPHQKQISYHLGKFELPHCPTHYTISYLLCPGVSEGPTRQVANCYSLTNQKIEPPKSKANMPVFLQSILLLLNVKQLIKICRLVRLDDGIELRSFDRRWTLLTTTSTHQLRQSRLAELIFTK